MHTAPWNVHDYRITFGEARRLRCGPTPRPPAGTLKRSRSSPWGTSMSKPRRLEAARVAGSDGATRSACSMRDLQLRTDTTGRPGPALELEQLPTPDFCTTVPDSDCPVLRCWICSRPSQALAASACVMHSCFRAFRAASYTWSRRCTTAAHCHSKIRQSASCAIPRVGSHGGAPCRECSLSASSTQCSVASTAFCALVARQLAPEFR